MGWWGSGLKRQVKYAESDQTRNYRNEPPNHFKTIAKKQRKSKEQVTVSRTER